MIPLKTPPCEDAVIRAAPDTAGCRERAKPWVLVATILGSSMAFIDGSVVNVALPAIQRDLGATIAAMQWVVNGYALFLAALILVGGAAGDRYGRRRVFVAGIALFTAASVGCGLAADAPQLIAARAAQGVGGALLVPNSLVIIGAAFPERERGRAIGTWAAFSALTTAIGPVLGGWLVDEVSWRAIFLLNVPLALVTLAVTLWRVPESRDEEAAALDGPGALLAVLGLGALSYGLIAGAEVGWRRAEIYASLAGGAAALLAFLWHEARARAPMMPLPLFRSPAFGGANLLTLLLYFALGGAFFFLPFNLIQVQGYPATLAGAAFLPFTLILGGLSRWSGGLVDRFGARPPLVVGPIIAAAGFALLAVPGVGGGSYWTTFFPGMVVLGLGMAVAVAPLSTTVMNAVPGRSAGVASGVNNAVARVATLLAVAVLGAVALAAFDAALAARVAALALPPELARAAEEATAAGLLNVELPEGLGAAETRTLDGAIDSAFLVGFRTVMLIAAGLALAGALAAGLMIRPSPAEPPSLRAAGAR